MPSYTATTLTDKVEDHRSSSLPRYWLVGTHHKVAMECTSISRQSYQEGIPYGQLGKLVMNLKTISDF
jgi:hypothetical protein